MTSNSRTARCGPACRVVWQGCSQVTAPYADGASEVEVRQHVQLPAGRKQRRTLSDLTDTCFRIQCPRSE